MNENSHEPSTSKQDTLNAQIVTALEQLAQAKPVIVRTDTGYGIAADATNQAAVDSVFSLKKRNKNQPVSIAVASTKLVREIIHVESRAWQTLCNWLPGAITIVAPSTGVLGRWIASSEECIGVRVPADDACLRLCEEFGKPITITSANISGSPTPFEWVSNDAEYSWAKDLCVVGTGRCLYSETSTIVLTLGDELELLRSGVVAWQNILECYLAQS